MNILRDYLQEIYKTTQRGDAREESYYESLTGVLKQYTEAVGKTDIQITTLPKKTEAGNPDFRVWDGSHHIVGYLEAKAPTVEDLNRIEWSEQLQRYLHTFPNLILTNFLEFRLYRDGILVDKVQIGRPFVLHHLQTVPPVEHETEFLALLEKFFAFSLPQVYEAKPLAIELAKRTRFLRDQVILRVLREEEETGKTVISGFYDAFKTYLISGLTQEAFADLYAQTITYGLFAARTRAENSFNRKLAYDHIPPTIGILRDLFKFISWGEVPKPMEWMLDDIAEVLAITDVKHLLHQYFHEGKGADPIVHFYETFLAEYDPETREKRGVYYTPEPVVSYIVRSLHQILKTHFGRSSGFADESVTVLDPAGGTLTFLAEAAKLAVNEFVKQYGSGKKGEFIKTHILEHFYAFELMMAPYAVGHLKMAFLLAELGYPLQEDDRFKLYLTNTLEMEDLAQIEIPTMKSISQESHLAAEVKKQQPILVILGNPPYSVSSANKSVFIEDEMQVYKEDVKSERNIQPLSDDYIKFIRFAHWKIDQAGIGVIGMITNNSYLSGLIHRGMRKKLLESFNEIYVLNLHGNVRIGEKCPDGSKDENVFDIMQGVAIALFIKHEKQTGLGKVFYEDVYGVREKKQDYLNDHDASLTRWKEIPQFEPYYFFVEKDFSQQANYEIFWAIPKIFPTFSSGVKTHRDHFIVGFSEEEVKQRMVTFASDLPDELIKQSLDLKDTGSWNLKVSRENIKRINWKRHIRSYAYRPFDNRYLCYLSSLIDRDRWDIMQNFFEDNLGLVTTRSEGKQVNFSHSYLCNYICDIHYSGGQTYVFPLYLYLETDKKDLFSQITQPGHKEPNISPKLLSRLAQTYHTTPTPEEIFSYIYAVLYSNIYRTKYAEFLKIDFPRIPFTQDYDLFRQMGAYGQRLVDLHLLKSPEFDPPLAKFQGEGESLVEKLRYDQKTQQVFINPHQYFEGVSEEVWDYQIGGYQVCQKWLKDRKGRGLSLEDIEHYCKVVTAIQKTIELQEAIDAIYSDVEDVKHNNI